MIIKQKINILFSKAHLYLFWWPNLNNINSIKNKNMPFLLRFCLKMSKKNVAYL